MRSFKSLCAAVALGTALLCASTSHATPVSFVSTGTFSGGISPNTAVYDNGAGVNIAFNPSLNNNVDAPPASQVSFGTFDSSATTASSFQGVSSSFTLNIFQTGPAVGVLNFVGTLAGTLKFTNSQAYVDFGPGATGSLPGGPGVTITYSIISADGGTPGRVAISAPQSNAGQTTISGLVNAVVPEPSSLILLGLGAPMLLVYRARRNRVAAAA